VSPSSSWLVHPTSPLLTAGLLLVSVASAMGAQGRAAESAVPMGYLPPAGMCRIWVQGVPAAKQPAPTDCATALKNNPANGRVIFGPSKDSSRAGGVGALLRNRRTPVPVATLLPGAAGGAPPTRPPASADAAARRDSLIRRDSAVRRDSAGRRDSTMRRDSIDAARRR
jgi:hypothetical protein